MSILITADLHWTDNVRDAYRHGIVKRLCNLIRKHHVEMLLILGDLTEAKEGHSAELVNEITDHVHELSLLCDVIILQGNHDYKGNPDHPFFAFLSHIPHVRWIRVPTLGVHLHDLTEGVQPVLEKAIFLPHTSNYGRDWKDLDLNQDWIFAHNTFAGADGGNGRKLSGIPTSVFPKRARVIAGDVHIPQERYVGSPYTVDFGDDFEPRVLMIQGKKVTSIPIGGPQKRLVEVYSPTELLKQKGLNEGDILKVKMHIASGEYDRWPEYQDKIRKWGEARGFIVHMTQPIIAGKGQPSRKKTNVTTKSDEELLKAYAKSRRVDERTLQTGLTLLRKS